MDKKELINLGAAGLGTGLTYAFGRWDTALIVLVFLIGLDYITGIMRAMIEKKLSSSIGFRGFIKKIFILVVIVLGVMVDRLTNTGTWMFRTLICYFYIANEGNSILENSVAIGLPVPQKLKDALLQLKEGNKKEIKEVE